LGYWQAAAFGLCVDALSRGPCARAAQEVEGSEDMIPVPEKTLLSLTVNGVERQISVAPWTTLLDALRDHLGLTGWGIGMALHEETLIDHHFGRIMNANIAEYHVPVNADVHDIKVIFVDEPDDIINSLGIKGLGEIGMVGVGRGDCERDLPRDW
jgi:hypothetical protein